MYRIFSNLIRILFTVSGGLKKIRCGLESRADYIRGRELDFEKNDRAAVLAVRTIK